jgi:hypothetical protein
MDSREAMAVVNRIRPVLILIIGYTSDTSTINELIAMIDDAGLWPKAHDLFDRIRDKTIKTDRTHDGRMCAQYCFEEICAKTIYNLTDPIDPFDDDSMFWVFPLALDTARRLGIDSGKIVDAIAPP